MMTYRDLYVTLPSCQPCPMDALGLGKAIDLVRDIMSPVGETVSEVWAGMLGDRVSYWRARNAMRYRPLLAAEARRLGLRIDATKIPEKFAFAWFEEATKQDEPELQIMFARLLARAADASTDALGDRRLVNVLARLTPEDASLFQRLYSDRPFPDTGAYADTRGIGHPGSNGWPVDWLSSLLGHVHPGYSPLALDNLVLQGCIRRSLRVDFRGGSVASSATSQGIAWDRELRERIGARDFVEATDLGRVLHAAVRD